MTKDDIINKRVKEHLQEALRQGAITEDNWFIIAPYGSMNYGLWDEDSDVDTKILKIPDMRDIIQNIGSRRILTKEIEFENEKIEIKDIREYFRILKSGSINFMELLFSNYVQVNPLYMGEWLLLKSKREEIARAYYKKTLSSALGMAKNNFYIFEKTKKIKPFIYVLRLEFFLENYVKGIPYEKCLTVEDLPKIKELLLKFRHTEIKTDQSYKILLKKANSALDKITEIVNNNNNIKDKNNIGLEQYLYEINRSLILKMIKEK